ncbi:MAG: accessory gene regulator B family protein [Roseburia sp.]|nr:accessory gene regulator B family protein [Roseburia sp.]
MLERFAGRLTGRMLASQIIPEENVGLVSFGIVQGLRSIAEMFAVLITGFALGMFWQSMILLVTFIPLRIYAGGYHAKTPVQCAIMTWLLFLGSLMWLRFVPGLIWRQMLVVLMAGVCIWICSPVEHENKPLEEYEITKYKRRARVIYLTEAVLSTVLYAVGLPKLSQTIAAGILMVCGIMMIAVAEKKTVIV